MTPRPVLPAPGPSRWRGPATRAVVSGALLLVWLVVAVRWVPTLIEAGYAGASLEAVNRLFAGRSEHPLAEYLGYWRNVTWLGAIWCVAIWFVGPLWRWLSRPSFFEHAVGAATPGTLGAIRAWACGTLLVMTLWEDLASSALLPREMMRPQGVMMLLHALPIGVDAFLADATALWIFEHVTALLLLLGVVGLGTRFVVPAAAVCYLVLAGILRGYAWFYHTGLIPIYVLAVLSFTPCDQGWSLDRLWRIARQRPVPPADRPTPAYGWGRYAVWTVIAVPYVAAGCSKLYYTGPDWLAADNMRAILLRTTLAMMEFDFRVSVALVPGPDVIFWALGAAGLGTELVFGLVLVSRRARAVLPAMMALVHVGILFLQNILFIDLIVLQAVFYDWRSVRLAFARRLAARRAPVDVLYDGECGLCQRTIQLLRTCDLLSRLRLVDFRALDHDDYARRTGVRLEAARLEREMMVVARGRVAAGFRSYRVLAAAVPILWPLWPLLYLPGVAVVGDAVYAAVAARRGRVCARPPVAAADDAGPGVHRRGALAAVGLVAVLSSWWVTHIEFFPLTTMKMFALPDPRPGTVGYVWAIAHYEDGTSGRAPFERWIGAVADSRYRMVISAAFGGPAERRRCQAFLDAAARAADRRAGGPRLTSVELQLWEWDFLDDPHSPDQGVLKDRYVHAVARGAGSAG